MIHQLKSNTRHTKEGLARFHLTFFVAIAVGCFSIYAVNTWPVSHRFNLITRPERHYRILSFLWKSNRSKNCSQTLCDNAIVLLETRNKSRITFFSDFFSFSANIINLLATNWNRNRFWFCQMQTMDQIEMSLNYKINKVTQEDF